MIKLSLLMFFFSLNTFAAPYVAKVIYLRGKSTCLSPGEKKARKIKSSDKFVEDDSILTYDKSILKIRFFDKSVTTLGSRSKLVIKKSNPDKGSILGLLKGKIRSSMKTDKKKRLFIKTRSAAIGVRGTDFQTIYNHKIFATSLITFNGQVAMAKIRQKRGTHQQRKKISSSNPNSNVDTITIKLAATNEFDEFSEFDKLLDQEKAVKVNPGRFSTTVASLERATVPVKISPTQYKLLKENKNLKESKKSEEIIKEKIETEQIIEEPPETVLADEPPPEGFFNEKTQEFAPRAGGYLDPETGIYVPPEKTAKFDKLNKVYIPSEKMGGITSKTGNYAAPEGLELNAKNGFIVDKKLPTTEKSELLAMQTNLNKHIKTSIETDTTKKETVDVVVAKIKTPMRGKRYRIGSVHASVGLIPLTEKLNYKNKQNAQEFEFDSETSPDILINVNWRISKTWGTGVEIQGGSIEYNDYRDKYNEYNSPHQQENDRSKFFLYGLYFHTPSLYLKAGPGTMKRSYAKIDQYTVTATGTDLLVSSAYFEDMESPFFQIKFGAVFYDKQSLNITGELGSAVIFGKKQLHLEVGTGLELNANINALWRFSRKWSLSGLLHIAHEQRKATSVWYSGPDNSGYATRTEYETKRNNLGIGLTINCDI